MNYFITGGTGFIGKFLVEKLLSRGGAVYVLYRKESKSKFQDLQERFAHASDRVIGVPGDLTKKSLGLSKKDINNLAGKIDHFFHVAAIYDLSTPEDQQYAANVEGTRAAIQCAENLKARNFHYVSSVLVSGFFRGTFREDMFCEAENLNHPYARTKHKAEEVVRSACKIPYRIYRPSAVVGHSRTGEIDKIDGPYYVFPAIKKLRDALPKWIPLIGVEAGLIPVVPVDYVVDVIDHIAHKDKLEDNCFHIVGTRHYTVGELFNVFAEAANAPQMAVRLSPSAFNFVPRGLINMVVKLPPVKRIIDTVFESIGMPSEATMMLDTSTVYDNRSCERALRGSGIGAPDLADYAGRLWDYWLRNLDPQLFVDRSLRGSVEGRVVVVTGGGTGIGQKAALVLAEAGARVIVAGRTLETLQDTVSQVKAIGGEAFAYTCNIADLEDCDRFVAEVLRDHGKVDILINNAGRSIRRSIESCYDRFDTFERTMQLNYFGAIRLTMGFLPAMTAAKSGHIVNVSSMMLSTMPARFAAYAASKAALDAFSNSAAAEFIDQNVFFTSIHMPVVRTPMIAPVKIYEHLPALTIDQAVELVVEAVITKKNYVVTPMGRYMKISQVFAPRLTTMVMNTAYRMFSEAPASDKKGKGGDVTPTSEQVALANLMKGIHF